MNHFARRLDPVMDGSDPGVDRDAALPSRFPIGLVWILIGVGHHGASSFGGSAPKI